MFSLLFSNRFPALLKVIRLCSFLNLVIHVSAPLVDRNPSPKDYTPDYVVRSTSTAGTPKKCLNIRVNRTRCLSTPLTRYCICGSLVLALTPSRLEGDPASTRIILYCTCNSVAFTITITMPFLEATGDKYRRGQFIFIVTPTFRVYSLYSSSSSSSTVAHHRTGDRSTVSVICNFLLFSPARHNC